MRALLIFAVLLGLTFTFSTNSLSAQPQTEGYEEEGGGAPTDATDSNEPVVRDGVYDKISVKERQILEYDHVREADVFWQKRVWRVIDTRQKMNLPFTYPDQPFIDILLTIVRENPDVHIFMDDDFQEEISMEDVDSRLGSVDTIEVYNVETYEYEQKIIKNDFDWTSVNRFRIKEDWVFDEETSRMIVRILAIAPIRDVIDDNGNMRGQQAMFYAYYPDFREHLAHFKYYNPENDLDVMTWEDVMEMRMFSSYIMKESNILDRRIEKYATGRDALLESERVKKEIFEKEHNLWEY